MITSIDENQNLDHVLRNISFAGDGSQKRPKLLSVQLKQLCLKFSPVYKEIALLRLLLRIIRKYPSSSLIQDILSTLRTKFKTFKTLSKE